MEKTLKQRLLPLLVPRKLRGLPGRAVETCWSPLTPEHGFPSLSIGPGTRRSPLPAPAKAGCRRFPHRLLQKNSGRFRKESAVFGIPYAGITRIRFHGVGVPLLHLSRENPAPILICSCYCKSPLRICQQERKAAGSDYVT